MKHITFISAVLFLFSYYNALSQSAIPVRPLNHLTDFSLRGKVKSFKVTPYRAIDSMGIIKRGPKLETWTGDDISFFNQQGYKIEREKYTQNEKLQLKVVIAYNDKNQRITRNIYNTAGKITAKYVYHYDKTGHKIAYNTYHTDGELIESWKYVNDNNGREIEVTYHNYKNPILNQKFTYQYNKLGKIHIITKINLKTGQPQEFWKYTYNNRGLIQVLENYKNNSLMYKIVIIYDNFGNEKSMRTTDKEGNFIEEKQYQYTFDSNGNWTERIEYTNLFPKVIYVRDINYY